MQVIGGKALLRAHEFLHIARLVWHRDTREHCSGLCFDLSSDVLASGRFRAGGNDLKKYKAIIPCGIKDKGITNLKMIKDLNKVNKIN